MTNREALPTDEEEESPPDILFHYTTQAGMLGIVESNSLFATKIQYFNDSAEFHLTLRLAERVIDDLVREGGRRSASDEDMKGLVEEIQSIEHANIFAVSLSALGDSLSQWRSYGAPGSAFAVGLRRPDLEANAHELGWKLLKCVYEPVQHRLLVGQAVESAMAADSLEEGCSILREELMTVASAMKHYSFEEEQEWRLVSPLWPEQVDLLMRVGRFTPLPYLLFPIVGLHNGESAIEEIMVGPTPHRDLAIMATAAYLRRLGISARVTASGTTFREW
jgi:hypothetical protein